MTALIYCPFPDADHAKDVAKVLLKENLIACANIQAPVQSLFKWDGELHCEEEIGTLFKTSEALLTQCIERLGGLHRYDSPAILGWACDAAHPSTKVWLDSLGA